MSGSLEPGTHDKRPAATMVAAGRFAFNDTGAQRRYGVPPFNARYCVSAAFTF